MRRQFKTFALFDSTVVRGELISDPLMQSIYFKMKAIGFRETRWQYIYDGQIGGLVLPYTCDGSISPNEIHVRFYGDRIFAEFEIGRAYVQHFIGPRQNANEFLVEFLSETLSMCERDYLRKMMHPDLMRSDEAQMGAWDGSSDIFLPQKKKQTILSAAVLLLCYIDVSWKWIAAAALAFAVFSFASNILIGAVIAVAGGAALGKLLPSRGSP